MNKLVSGLFFAVDRLMPVWERRGSEYDLRNARIVYIALVLLLANALGFGLLGIYQGDQVLPWIVLGSGLACMITPELHKRTRSVRWAAAWIGFLGTCTLMFTGILSGGMHSTSNVWFGALAAFILVTQGTRVALGWAVLLSAYALIVWWLPAHGVALPDFENPADKAFSWALSFPASLALTLSLLHGFFEAHHRAIVNLDEQTRKLRQQSLELGQAKNAAEAASRSRSEFIATVSHEIRTPMNGILGVAQLLNGTALNEEQRKYLAALQLSAEGLLSIVGDILDFSKIEAGKLEITPEQFHLKSLCVDSLSVFAGITQSKGITATLSLNPGLPDLVMGDPVRIRQILLNLIGNSVKFTERGGINLEVTPDAKREGWVRFAVRDTGIGMSEATLKLLFQPYMQADASSSRRYGGTGLGLAICHRLTGMMRGALTVESKLGIGTAFTLGLPLDSVAPQNKPPGKSRPQAQEHEAASNPQAEIKGRKILLAEDNAINRMVAVKMLESLGASVEVAIDGRDAVNRWLTGHYDLILMDCQMPGMDGYDAARMIRSLEKEAPARARVPVIALTAHAMEEDRQRCLESGMDEYLTKPVKAETLRQALRVWVK